MFLRAVESRISSAVEHFTRNEGVPSSNLGFGSKVRGRRPETQRKTAAKQFAGGFLLRNVTRESEADFRKRPCGKQPREDERSEVKFGFGSKVRGRRPETQRKTAAKQFAGGFLLRNVTRESEADFRKRPCGKQPREDERSEVKFGFGSKVRGRRPETQRKTAAKQFAGGFPVAGIAHPPGRANPKHVKGPDRGFKNQETDNGYSPAMAWR